MVLLSEIIKELRENITNNKILLSKMLSNSPQKAYQYANELARFTGLRYHVNLQLHFPDSNRIFDIDTYGTENIGIVIDKNRRRFPLSREDVKKKAFEILGNNIHAHDAYMYEGKEGVKVILEYSRGRIEVLPGSIHLWCKIEPDVARYGDWLMENVYSSTDKTL
jgi:hypothetical protein